MEKSTKKKLIVLGALLVIGGVVAYIVIKKPFSKKGSDTSDTGSPPAGDTKTSTIDADLPPPVVPTNVLASSFADLKTALGSNAQNFGNHLIYETNQKSLNIGSGTAKVIVKFTNGGRWALFLREIKVANRINEGAYYAGGKKVVVYSGKNKGLVVEGNSVINNIARSAM